MRALFAGPAVPSGSGLQAQAAQLRPTSAGAPSAGGEPAKKQAPGTAGTTAAESQSAKPVARVPTSERALRVAPSFIATKELDEAIRDDEEVQGKAEVRVRDILVSASLSLSASLCLSLPLSLSLYLPLSLSLSCSSALTLSDTHFACFSRFGCSIKSLAPPSSSWGPRTADTYTAGMPTCCYTHTMTRQTSRSSSPTSGRCVRSLLYLSVFLLLPPIGPGRKQEVVCQLGLRLLSCPGEADHELRR